SAAYGNANAKPVSYFLINRNTDTLCNLQRNRQAIAYRRWHITAIGATIHLHYNCISILKVHRSVAFQHLMLYRSPLHRAVISTHTFRCYVILWVEPE